MQPGYEMHGTGSRRKRGRGEDRRKREKPLSFHIRIRDEVGAHFVRKNQTTGSDGRWVQWHGREFAFPRVSERERRKSKQSHTRTTNSTRRRIEGKRNREEKRIRSGSLVSRTHMICFPSLLFVLPPPTPVARSLPSTLPTVALFRRCEIQYQWRREQGTAEQSEQINTPPRTTVYLPRFTPPTIEQQSVAVCQWRCQPVATSGRVSVIPPKIVFENQPAWWSKIPSWTETRRAGWFRRETRLIAPMHREEQVFTVLQVLAVFM